LVGCVLATLEACADDVISDDVGNPACPVQGEAATSRIYERDGSAEHLR